MPDQYEPYDYAWQTRGWTVQNPILPTIPLPPIYGDPGLPDDVPKVLIVGTFDDVFSGEPIEGLLEYRTTDILVYTTSNVEIMPSVRQIRFTAAQPLAVLLPATDDDHLISPDNPDGWKYMFRLTVQGVTRTGISALPATADPVEIWTLLGDSQ